MRAEAVALVERVVDLPVHAGQSGRWHVLLRRAVVAVLVLKAEEQTVVDEDRWLLGPQIGHELARAPRRTLARLIGVVEPDRGQRAVVREQLVHVSTHVGLVALVVARVAILGVRRQRHLVGIRMLPVEERVVETGAQASRTHRVGELARDIAACGRDVRSPGDIVRQRIRLLRIEEREAVVVLRGQHRVGHARRTREFGPPVSEARIRHEARLHLPCVLGARHRGPVLDPLRIVLLVALAIPEAARRRVETPVDEHAEARIAPPRHARVAVTGPERHLLRFGRRRGMDGRCGHRHGERCEVGDAEVPCSHGHTVAEAVA